MDPKTGGYVEMGAAWLPMPPMTVEALLEKLNRAAFEL
jgi:hypothetical protein